MILRSQHPFFYQFLKAWGSHAWLVSAIILIPSFLIMISGITVSFIFLLPILIIATFNFIFWGHGSSFRPSNIGVIKGNLVVYNGKEIPVSDLDFKEANFLQVAALKKIGDDKLVCWLDGDQAFHFINKS